MAVAAKKAKEEIAELKKSYAEWETKLERVTAKKLELEQFIEEFGDAASEKLKEFCDDVAEEAEKIEKELDSSRELLKYSSALALLHLEERVEQVLVYIKRLSTAVSDIDRDVFPDEEP